jgi:hypothetical protein
MGQACSNAYIQIILEHRNKPVQEQLTPAEEIKFRWPVIIVNIIFVVTVQPEAGRRYYLSLH